MSASDVNDRGVGLAAQGRSAPSPGSVGRELLLSRVS